ncbi:FAD-dependent oxidoreductase [Rhizobium sp. OAE497]|uniref:NAD(P)/FAD-dependent oxidoreductase n=1 Tax=Rhizobium sp. OAE497 TaxID=2663796 RepID=UPI0018F28383
MADFVIIGAGQCGARAAMALREQGFDGGITLVGEEPHLPYERPPLSKQHMLEPEAALPLFIAEGAAFAERGIAVVTDDAAARIDRDSRTVRLASGRTLPYDKLLLATGAAPRRLPAAEGLEHVFYLRTHDDAARLSRRLSPGSHLAIVGAGFIGLELAASARKRGLEVTVIEALPRILMRAVPEAIAEKVQALHEANGISILRGSGIDRLTGSADGVGLTLADGTVVNADMLVVGIGAQPRIELAAQAGLTIENGIAVDQTLQTSDPAIFAAGDCCSFPYDGRRIRLEAWRNAQDQGAHAAASMLGDAGPYEAVPWFWSDQFDWTLQIAGLADKAVSAVRRDIGDDAFILFHLAENGRLVSASGWGPGNRIAKDIRLAEMLIAKHATPDPSELTSPAVNLKSLLPRG